MAMVELNQPSLEACHSVSCCVRSRLLGICIDEYTVNQFLWIPVSGADTISFGVAAGGRKDSMSFVILQDVHVVKVT